MWMYCDRFVYMNNAFFLYDNRHGVNNYITEIR